MSGEEVEEVKIEEATELVTNEEIKEEPKEEIKEEPKEEATEVVEEAKPKAKAKAMPKKLPRSVKVVELVECQACNKKMLPKSLRNTHPHYCKGQPTETLPVNKQKASYGSKVEEKLRKEIEAEMKAKYERPKEQIQYSEPIEVASVANARESLPSVKMKAKPIRMEEQPRQLTATELLQQSYNEMKRLKQQEKQEKINGFKLKMF